FAATLRGVKVPGFLARQFYVAGSLRNTPTGFQLEAQNPMGNGVLVGIGRLSVDGREISRDAVTAQRVGDGADGQAESELRAADLTRFNPIRVSKGDRVTLRVAGDQLKPGDHILEVELDEINLGRLSFALSDRLTED
ncbi:MAG TPA: hypothetical protein VMP67_12420, partial [Candidatus Limnocylindria bacterium]|nr:hypothetical protein [Candidatus Limnocylindria bacterium]